MAYVLMWESVLRLCHSVQTAQLLSGVPASEAVSEDHYRSRFREWLVSPPEREVPMTPEERELAEIHEVLGVTTGR